MGTVLHATKTKAAIIITLAFNLKDLITAFFLKKFALPLEFCLHLLSHLLQLAILDGSGCGHLGAMLWFYLESA